jgi:two-component system alkaline phosphatase synthesis response regulator PhoP
MLIAGIGRAIGREELLQKVWGYDFIGETRTLDMHIGTLRQKLGDDPTHPQYIKTVRGVGYRFIAEKTGD